MVKYYNSLGEETQIFKKLPTGTPAYGQRNDAYSADDIRSWQFVGTYHNSDTRNQNNHNSSRRENTYP